MAQHGGKRQGAGRKKKPGIARKINLRLSAEEWKQIEDSNQTNLPDAIYHLIFEKKIKQEEDFSSYEIENKNQEIELLQERVKQLEEENARLLNSVLKNENEDSSIHLESKNKNQEIQIDNDTLNQKRLSEAYKKGEIDYWFHLVYKGLWASHINIGKGTLRRACKYRGLDKNTTDSVLDFLFRMPRLEGEPSNVPPFRTDNQRKNIQVFLLDGYARLINKNRVECRGDQDKNDVALALVDQIIQEKWHWSPEARKKSNELQAIIDQHKLPSSETKGD